eukprot:TRINITY_DN386_c0_g1_i3.p1 TRINITY_DN386_c0_g1~~TRINITY_DN386_c0_g1_i3.p1  ORF type:complete len:256 (-),score=102.37 TRINITY_DN386_c0_g1_i3:264-959(-)
MADKKIIVVFGATGQQGGSVVDFLLEDGTFAVRGVTRSVDSDKAKALTARGVQMVAANVADAASFAKGKGVFDDAYGAFIITNFWDPSSMGKELEQGVALVDAAEACGVKALQYGSLVDVEKISGGKLDVPHFTHKAKVEQYVLEKKNFEFTAFSGCCVLFLQHVDVLPAKGRRQRRVGVHAAQHSHHHRVRCERHRRCVAGDFQEPGKVQQAVCALRGRTLHAGRVCRQV